MLHQGRDERGRMPAAAIAHERDVGAVSLEGSPPTGRILRDAIDAELRARNLDDAASLAGALGVLPFTAEGLLARHDWAPETARFVINRLDLPIEAPAEPERPSRPCLADVVGYGG